MKKKWDFKKFINILLNIYVIMLTVMALLLIIMYSIGIKRDNIEKNFLYILSVFLIAFIDFYIVKKLINATSTQQAYRKYLINELERNESLAESEKKYPNKTVERINEFSDNIITNEQKKDDKKDILALMLKNNDEITDYFKISKSQARSSFWFSVVFCIVGLVCLVFGIYGIVNLKDVSISIISLISGSLSEFISATIFWLHNKSALQLNHYYEALHENEKFLSAVNIADKLSDERREEMLVEIIRNQISAKPSKNETENNK